MAAFSVRSVTRWIPRSDQKKTHLYEERITLWNASSIEEAVDLAEAECKDYSKREAEALDLFQAYLIDREIEFDSVNHGREVFSLLRESDLDPKEYLDAFFDSKLERQGTYDPSKASESPL